MGNAETDVQCYFVRIYHDERQGNMISFHTIFVKYADTERRIELREPSILSYERLNRGYQRSEGVPLPFLTNVGELCLFWERGGAAAIQLQLAEACIPEHLEPQPMTNSGYGMFSNVPEENLEAALKRAPSKKARMKILERDNYRCRVCGQSPNNDVNVELHVHHLRPWENSGATVPSNLVTLCHTCHGGLDPHWNRKLAELIEDKENLYERFKVPPKYDR